MGGLTIPQVLVIDADPISLSAVSAALESQHYSVSQALDRSAALQLAHRANLDLVICDVHLKDDDGVELCKSIRLMDNHHDVPVMFLSSSQLPSVASRMFQNGSAYFLKKPFDLPVLLDLADKALWMPHLVKAHVHRPHIPMPGFSRTPMVDQAQESF